MYLDGKRVFLAGATGLAGSGIAGHILENCPSVKIRASYFHAPPFLKDDRIEYVWGDLRVLEDCRRMVKGCDCAIMAAGNTGGAAMLTSQPWSPVNDNAIMSVQFLDACCAENIKRVVWIGSATLYQEFEGHIREDELDLNKDPCGAYMGIGWVSRFVEKLCRFRHNEHGIEVIMARASNIFGPYASFDPARSNFIPAIIRKAADRMDPFEVWGQPDVTRDVIYVEDVARAIVAMLDHTEIKCDVFNLGSGGGTTVGEVVELALRHAGHCPSAITYRNDKPVTIKFRGIDCAKAVNLLGWTPICALDEAIGKTTEWWIKNKMWWKK